MANLLDDSIGNFQRAAKTVAAGDPAMVTTEVGSLATMTLCEADAMRAGRVGMWRLDLADERLSSCPTCRDIYGCADGALLDLDRFVGAVHPADRDRRAQAINEAIASGSGFDIEFRIDAATGGERWVAMRGGLLRGDDGRPQALAGILIDVTARRLAEEQRALIAEELTHRIRNNVMLMQAIAGQTLRSARTVAEARAMLEARIVALATSSVRLLETDGEDTLLVDVLREALTPFGFDTSPAFQWAGPEVSLPPHMAIAFGLALHELAMNAVKHGALSVPAGEIRIVWSLGNGDDRRLLQLSWEERNGPPITGPVGTGFGTRLIRRCLENRIGGQVKIEYRDIGFRMDMLCPLASPAGPP